MALLHVDFFSEVLEKCMNMDVILPQNTTSQIGMKGNAKAGKYKTVYLLHGMSDDHTTWQRRTSIERYVSEYGIAVVMPDAGLGFYTDTKYGLPYWTFFHRSFQKSAVNFFHSCRKRGRIRWQPDFPWEDTERGNLALEHRRHSVQRHLCPEYWM